MGQNRSSTEELKEGDNVEFFDEPNSLRSPLILSFDAEKSFKKYVFNVKEDVGNLTNFDNYGKIPVVVLHQILLYCMPITLPTVFSTCKLFNEVASTNMFWRTYYHVYYRILPLQCESREKERFPLNWRKQFFRRYAQNELAEHVLKKTYKIITKAPTNPKTKMLYNTFVLLGSKGVGKRTYLQRFLKDRYTENSQIESVDFQMTRKEVGKVLKNYTYTILAKENVSNELYPTGYFLCFDLSDLSSFQAISTHLKDVLKSWDLESGDTNQRFNIIVVGLKSDLLREKRKVKKENIVKFVRSNHLKGYCEVSSQNGCNILLPLFVMGEKASRFDYLRDDDYMFETID